MSRRERLRAAEVCLAAPRIPIKTTLGCEPYADGLWLGNFLLLAGRGGRGGFSARVALLDFYALRCGLWWLRACGL